MFRLLSVFVFAYTLVAFQYPGQVPPGQYPPGQGPGGQDPAGPLGRGGLSLPSRGHKKNQKAVDQQPSLKAEGVVVTNDGKKLAVATEDGRVLTMTIAPATKWLQTGNNIAASSVSPRKRVHIEAAEDDEAFLTALTVELLKDTTPPVTHDAEPSATGNATGSPAGVEEVAKSTIQKTPEAPDRPILRRGKPTEPKTADSATATAETTQRAASPKKADDGSIDFTIDAGDANDGKKHANAYDQLIEKTRQWAMNFTNGLPNFLCQQSTTRYMEQSRSEGFQPIDVVTAKVLYEDGRERYSQITVGGRRTNKGMMEVGGSTSTGEFASVLSGLFDTSTRTDFKFYQSTVVAKQAAAIFDFKVALRNSNWTIQVGGQMLRPTYSGSVWIDKATAQVRRLEMQADNIPKDFPDDSVASAVDYEEVPLGTSKFLLPVHAENLSCQRGSSICTKNMIDFRDYHKYSGESTIEFK